MTGCLCAVIGTSLASGDSLLPPRNVLCARGGMFTQLRAVASSTASSSTALFGQLQICCTTSIVIEGFRDIEEECTRLGDGVSSCQLEHARRDASKFQGGCLTLQPSIAPDLHNKHSKHVGLPAKPLVQTVP
jgi:hypothetical protein